MNDSTSIPDAPVPSSTGPTSARYFAALGVWLSMATLAALAGVVSEERFYMPMVGIAAGVAGLVLAYRRSEGFRRFVLSVKIRWLLLFHAVRAPIGVAFLWLMSRGTLSPEFALPAGWGDIAAGILALALVPLSSSLTPARRSALSLWNAFGLLDIALVLATAQRILLVRGDVPAMRGLLEFPGPLLPFFVVPLVITTHVLLFTRLAREGRGANGQAAAVSDTA